MGEEFSAFEEMYGFLPVPTKQLGSSIFLLVVYGFVLLQGANLLSDGSEMLLEVFPPGIIGGIVLPILGALPDCLIIVVSGMGPKTDAIQQVKVGLGTLAGSTVMLLTIAWGGSMLLGRCDLEMRGSKLVAKDKKLTKPCDVVETGVTADKPTQVNAIIMTLSVLLYFIVHIPALAGVTKDPEEYPSHKIPSLVGFICCMIALVVYIIFQVVYPDRRRRVLSRLRRRAMHDKAMHHLAKEAKTRNLGPLVGHNGELDVKAASGLFHRFDLDGSGHIDRDELKKLLMGMAVTMSDSTMEKEIEAWMNELDKDVSTGVSEAEFIAGLRSMLSEKKADLRAQHRGLVSDEEANRHLSVAISVTPRTRLLEEYDEEDEDDEDDHDEPKTRTEIIVEACIKLAIGAGIAALFADPMVGTVTSFATASHIPPFFVAFVVTPLASNASELVSSLNFARKMKKKNISLTFSQVYGAVTMNNTLCLGLFLLVVYVQNLTWDYTAEVTAIVIPTIIVGCVGLSATTFRTYVALLVLPLYIVGICIVLVFKTCFPNID